MKLNLVILFAGILLISSHSIKAQNTGERKYVKIIVNGVHSSLDAREIDLFIRTQAGIITSRMDVRTNVYFGVYLTSSGLKTDDFKTWLTDLGYSVKCSVEDIHGKGKTIKMTAFNCQVKDELTTELNQN